MQFALRAVIIALALILSIHLARATHVHGEDASSWRFSGGSWKDGRTGVSGEADGESRGFAVSESYAPAFAATVEALITPARHLGSSWSAGGLCFYCDSGSYWRLALVEAPDGKSHTAEMLQQYQGVGSGPVQMKTIEADAGGLNWAWGRTYRLRIKMSADRVTGEILSENGMRLWHIVYAATRADMLHFGRLALGLQGMSAQFRRETQDSPAAPASPITCEMLGQNAAKSAWLTLPNSRLVVNPTLSSSPTTPPSIASSLPVNLAWYVGEEPVRLPRFWCWQPAGAPPAIALGPALHFDESIQKELHAERATAAFEPDTVSLRVDTRPFGSIAAPVSVNLDRTPYLAVTVPRSSGGWALKVNSGNSSVDTYLQTDTTRTGTFLCDVRKATGWTGTRRFKMIFFALGDIGDVTQFANVRFCGATGSVPSLTVRDTRWYPHQITAAVETADRSLRAESAVFLENGSSVVQVLHVVEGAPQTLILSGDIPQGSAVWNPGTQAISIRGGRYSAAITLNRKVRAGGVNESTMDLLARGPLPAGREGRAWSLAIDDVKAGDEIVVTARFGKPDDALDIPTPDARFAGGAAAAAESLRLRRADWDARLAALPHPLSFGLSNLNAHGADAEMVRRAYYRAWVFLISDTLPPMAENGFAYPQVCCGKPSLWGEGSPSARATSQWESVLGMQYLGLIDPDTAWAALEGLLTQVGPDGVLPGEGLPTRFAQTSWSLYVRTGERSRLERIYPALKRLLVWKIADPRWLYKGSTPAGQKDEEFVVHALLDIGYARMIAAALGMRDEQEFWQQRRSTLIEQFHHWFWGPGAARSFRLFLHGTGTQQEPDRLWNLQGLALPASLLLPAERESFLKLLRTALDAGKDDLPFLIPELAAFPKYNLALHGVWRYGSPADAAKMAAAPLRDVALAGEFSENYTQSNPPEASGVVPSLFGALQAIDAALWRNGIRMGNGAFEVIPMPGAAGVWNLSARSGSVAVVFDQHARLLELFSAGFAAAAAPINYRAAALSDRTTLWSGPLPPHDGLALP